MKVTSRKTNARRQPGEGSQATTLDRNASTTAVNRGRRHYLLTCLSLGLLSPERVADAILREIDKEAS